MDKVYDLFRGPQITKGRGRSNSDAGPSTTDKGVMGTEKSLEFLKSQNFSRARFGYDIIASIGWWPDEILLYLDVIKLSYNTFINTYMAMANVFDLPIHNAIFFMNQKKYASIKEIKIFLQNAPIKMPDNYFNQMVSEDNCFFSGLEERSRSSNEGTHYNLARALDALLTQTPISHGQNTFEKEQETLVRIYCVVYRLRIMYSVIDDTLRTILRATLDSISLGIKLKDFFRDLLTDFDSMTRVHLKRLDDNVIFNYVSIFRYLVLYAMYSTIQFDFVFSYRRVDHLNDENPEHLSPFVQLLAKRKEPTPSARDERSHSETAVEEPDSEPHDEFDESTLQGIQYVYKYYLSLVSSQKQKAEIIMSSQDFDTMISDLKLRSVPHLPTPRFFIPRSPREETVDDFKSKHKHVRKSSVLGTIRTKEITKK